MFTGMRRRITDWMIEKVIEKLLVQDRQQKEVGCIQDVPSEFCVAKFTSVV